MKQASSRMPIIGVLVMLLSFSLHVSANPSILPQADAVVSGIVTDASTGTPMVGVSVMQKGTTSGTITDSRGMYTMTIRGAKPVLSFSYLGYATQDLPVVGTRLNVGLAMDAQRMDDIVVVGYGVKKKVNLTGAVEVASSEVIESRPVTSLGAALQGALSGVTIQNSSGQPGVNTIDIKIRGFGSVTSASNPLILIDGAEGDMSQLNPDDIESVSVLKDASSAAIYGARAGHGVVLVTTKRARENQTATVNYSGYYGYQMPTSLPERVDSYQFMMLRNEANRAAGLTPTFSALEISMYQLGIADPDRYSNTNWIDEVYAKAAPQQSHNLNISGSSGKTNYYMSYGYLNQEGIVQNSPYNSNRDNLRLRVNTEVKKWLSVDFNLAFAETDRNDSPISGTGGVFRLANRMSPLLPVKYANGYWANTYVDNPLRVIEDSGFKRYNLRNFSSNFQATLKLAKGLNLITMYSLNRQDNSIKTFNRAKKVFYETGLPNPSNASTKSTLTEGRYATRKQTMFATLNYDFTLMEDHNFSLMAGAERNWTVYDQFTGSREGFPLGDDLTVLDVGAADVQKNGGYGYEHALESVFGRASYDYQGKYLAEFNLRYDGSSRFHPDYRWGAFPSMSMAWKFTDEPFAEVLKDYGMQFGKLRFSWGQLGNQDAAVSGTNYYPYLSNLGSISGIPLGGENITAYYQSDLANSALSWETIEMMNLGVDFRFLNNRLTVSADWFKKDTKNMLLKATLSAMTGFASSSSWPEVNMGQLTNKGVEFTVAWSDRIADVKYSVHANYSYVNNKIISLGDSDPVKGDRLRMVGYAYNSYYGFKTDGLLQESDFTTFNDVTGKWEGCTAPVFTGFEVQPGDVKYVDTDGVAGLNDDDRVVIGNPNPKHTFSLRLEAAYKGFDFSAFLQGAGGVNGYISDEAIHPFLQNTGEYSLPMKTHLDRWTPNNPGAWYPRLYYGQSYSTRFSDYWVQDASYVRLKNLQLGYTIPSSITKKASIAKARFYISGENLFTLTDFYKYYDPETKETSGEAYPQVKTMIMGVNITF